VRVEVSLRSGAVRFVASLVPPRSWPAPFLSGFARQTRSEAEVGRSGHDVRDGELNLFRGTVRVLLRQLQGAGHLHGRKLLPGFQTAF